MLNHDSICKMTGICIDQLCKYIRYRNYFILHSAESHSIPNFSLQNINAAWNTNCIIHMYFDRQYA